MINGETTLQHIAFMVRSGEAKGTVGVCDLAQRWEIGTDTLVDAAHIVYRVIATSMGRRVHRTLVSTFTR